MTHKTPGRNTIARVFAITLLFLGAVAGQDNKPSAGPLVKFNLIVTDRTDRVVDDVRKEALQISDDGGPQAITYFAKDERPITCGFVIDASGSVRRMLAELIDSTKLVTTGLRENDEGFVARFVGRDNFRLKQEMTGDLESINDSIDGIYVEGGQTALHDAIDQALTYLEENSGSNPRSRHRILVLVSDGEDRASKIKDSQEILARVRKSDVQIFILALTKFSGLKSPNKATGFLNNLAEESGGRALFPDFSGRMPDAAKEIARSLHTQFVVGYAPGNKSPGERKIQVKWIGGADASKRRLIARPVVTED
jgi:Ca-activated chloride channel homolog